MNTRLIQLLLILTVLLSACGREDKPPQLFKEQRDVLDKAKAVDAVQQEQAEKQKQEIEQQTR